MTREKMFKVAYRNYQEWSRIWALAYKEADSETMAEAKEQKLHWEAKMEQYA